MILGGKFDAKSMGGSTMLLDTGEVRTVEDILKGIIVKKAIRLIQHLKIVMVYR